MFIESYIYGAINLNQVVSFKADFDRNNCVYKIIFALSNNSTAIIPCEDCTEAMIVYENIKKIIQNKTPFTTEAELKNAS